MLINCLLNKHGKMFKPFTMDFYKLSLVMGHERGTDFLLSLVTGCFRLPRQERNGKTKMPFHVDRIG
jgi:hypothetical protein